MRCTLATLAALQIGRLFVPDHGQRMCAATKDFLHGKAEKMIKQVPFSILISFLKSIILFIFP